MFDKKEEKIFAHYKPILENAMFDEYDILAFLIFMRRHLNKRRYPYLHDFADLIAHRGRNQGVAMDAIRGAIENKYTIVPEKKTIEGYQGVDQKKWEQEWVNLGREFEFTLNNRIILEATMCIFSLAQFTTYDDQEYCATMELFLFGDGCLALATEAKKPFSGCVCFAKCGPFYLPGAFSGKPLSSPVETVRENGILRLKDERGYII